MPYKVFISTRKATLMIMAFTHFKGMRKAFKYQQLTRSDKEKKYTNLSEFQHHLAEIFVNT